MSLAVAIAVVGCGDSSTPPPAEGVGPIKSGSTAALAQCSDWVAGTVDERLATIADIRGHSPDEERGLSDEAAYEILDSACSNEFARELPPLQDLRPRGVLQLPGSS